MQLLLGVGLLVLLIQIQIQGQHIHAWFNKEAKLMMFCVLCNKCSQRGFADSASFRSARRIEYSRSGTRDRELICTKTGRLCCSQFCRHESAWNPQLSTNDHSALRNWPNLKQQNSIDFSLFHIGPSSSSLSQRRVTSTSFLTSLICPRCSVSAQRPGRLNRSLSATKPKLLAGWSSMAIRRSPG